MARRVESARRYCSWDGVARIGDVRVLFLGRSVGRFLPWARVPIDYQRQDFVSGNSSDDGSTAWTWSSMASVALNLAFPQGAPSGGRVVAYGLTSSLHGGRLASGRSGAPSALSCESLIIRVVHRRQAGFSRPATSGALQHPVAQTIGRPALFQQVFDRSLSTFFAIRRSTLSSRKRFSFAGARTGARVASGRAKWSARSCS